MFEGTSTFVQTILGGHCAAGKKHCFSLFSNNIIWGNACIAIACVIAIISFHTQMVKLRKTLKTRVTTRTEGSKASNIIRSGNYMSWFRYT